MISPDFVEDKLIVMYLLDKMDIGLTDADISKLLLENHIMNYFSLKHQLYELVEQGFVESALLDDDRYVYTILQAGKNILRELEHMIPFSIRYRINELVEPTRADLKEKNQVIADFTPIDETQFIMTCSAAEEDYPLIKLDLNLSSRSECFDAIHNWKKHSGEIYRDILEAIMKNRDE